MSFESARIARCAGATLLVALSALGTAVHADSGSWSSHQIEFTFLGFTSTYSCEGLQSKLQALLRTFGARQDAVVRSAPCERGFGAPEKFASASLRFASLQPLEVAPELACHIGHPRTGLQRLRHDRGLLLGLALGIRRQVALLRAQRDAMIWRAISGRASISAKRMPRCTGRMARVLGVMAAAAAPASMQ